MNVVTMIGLMSENPVRTSGEDGVEFELAVAGGGGSFGATTDTFRLEAHGLVAELVLQFEGDTRRLAVDGHLESRPAGAGDTAVEQVVVVEHAIWLEERASQDA